MQDKRERNNAIVLVSHHMEDVAQFANRVWVMYKGKIAMDGTPGRSIFKSGRT